MEVSLLQLQSGRRARIKYLGGGLAFQRKLASLNIRIGKTIKKIAAQPFGGPVVIEIGNTRVTLGRGIAMRILLEVENEKIK